MDAICYFSAAVAESDETYWISTEGYVVEDVEERQLAAPEARFLFFCAATVQLLYSPSLASLGFRFFASSSVVSFDCWCVTISSSLQDNDDFDGKTALASHGSSVASAHLDCPCSASLNKQKVLGAFRSYGPKLFLSH